MHTWERERHIREEGREEGMEIGRENMLITLIKTKLEKGKDIVQIASEIEQSEDYVLELMKRYELTSV